MMKRIYKTPIAKIIDFSFDDNVVANSLPVVGLTDVDWYNKDKCTFYENVENCNIMFNVQAKGYNSCTAQGQ